MFQRFQGGWKQSCRQYLPIWIRANFPLCQESRTNMIDLSHDSLHLLERMIGYFYSGIYEGLTDKDATPGSHLTLHVEMFAFADKYDVPGLGEQASCHFQALLHKVRHVAECLSCVCAVYESTPHSNTRLRDLIVNHVVKLYVAEWEMSEPLLKAAFIETPQFGWDCFLQLQRNSISKDQWAAWNTLLQSRPTPYEKI